MAQAAMVKLRWIGRFLFGYDAVESKNRRQAPTGRLRSEDKELLPYQRRKLTSAARDTGPAPRALAAASGARARSRTFRPGAAPG